jgi:hypothetical protein
MIIVYLFIYYYTLLFYKQNIFYLDNINVNNLITNNNNLNNLTMQNLTSKRFVIRKSLIGKNQIIEVTFKSGKTYKYNHDKVYNIMQSKLNTMPCFLKYKSYTSSTSVPVILRDKVVL